LKKEDYEKVMEKMMAVVKPHVGLWDDPFHILITTILSTRTKDEVTDRAALKLFCKCPDPHSLAKCSVKQISSLIEGVGFYREKARNVKETARIIVEEFKGNVPDNREDLMKLPGVGPKVANIVLTFGFNKDYIAVDTHVHRIFNRLGIVNTKNPEETEKILMKKIPRKYWKHINSYAVEFGKNICKPIGPKCQECPLKEWCRFYENSS